jgi:CheY-like chemotaxis protein
MASILVIDDDQAVLATIKLLLEREAHAVVVTDDGRRGIDLFRTGSFDLLIVDIFMPAMDGLETMSLVHRLRPAVPIVLISSHESPNGFGNRPEFPAHGDQARRGVERSKALQAARPVDSR